MKKVVKAVAGVGRRALGAADGGGACDARLERRAAPLDLSQGHFGKHEGKVLSLPAVRTREDCFDWISEEDLEMEVWVAFRGAVRHAREFDFEACERSAWPHLPPMRFFPGTVLPEDGSSAYHDRSQFFEVLLKGIVWRLEALAERRGVTPRTHQGRDGELSTPLHEGRHQSVLEALADQSWLGKYFGGTVTTRYFKTKAEARAFLKAEAARQKATPAGATNTSGVMTNIQSANVDGPDCRP